MNILLKIQKYFGCGTIVQRVRRGQKSAIYSVQSIIDLYSVIIPHFNNYILLTQKRADFILFSQVVSLMYNKIHLTENVIYKILSFKAAMNKGLSSTLINLFPTIIPVARP
jgi:uridine kinase